MNRSHVIRLNPTLGQEVYFRKACGVARHAYNWALARWKNARAHGERVTMRELKTEYNALKHKQFPWCTEVTKCAPEFEVKRQLVYKTAQYGGRVQLVDRWYPSSKTCSGCRYIKTKLDLSKRMFVCEQCGLTFDRDFNASLNIEREAIRFG